MHWLIIISLFCANSKLDISDRASDEKVIVWYVRMCGMIIHEL